MKQNIIIDEIECINNEYTDVNGKDVLFTGIKITTEAGKNYFVTYPYKVTINEGIYTLSGNCGNCDCYVFRLLDTPYETDLQLREALRGCFDVESDPLFSDSPAAEITFEDVEDIRSPYFHHIPTTDFIFSVDVEKVQGMVLETAGFYEPGDGGGARYVIKDTGTVDNILVFAIAGGRFAHLLPNEDGGIDLLQLGALPNGSNTTVRMQKGIDKFNHVYHYESGTFSFFSRIKVKSGTRLEFGQETTMKQEGGYYDIMLYTDYRILNENITIIGGIWDKNYQVPRPFNTLPADGSFPTVQNMEHNFLMGNTKNLIIRDVKFLNTVKYAIFLGNFENTLIQNIFFDTDSDGVHVNGPGKNLRVLDIYGKTGDDFIAIAGADWVGYTFSEGDIDGVFVRNIHQNDSLGGAAYIFPGSLWEDNVKVRNYVVKNVVIDGVHGTNVSAGTPIIKLAMGSPNVADPNQRMSSYGELQNCTVQNVDVNHNSTLITCQLEVMKNIRFKNISSESSGSQIILGDTSLENNIDEIYFENVHLPIARAGVRPFEIRSKARVKNLYLNNVLFNVSGDIPWIQNQSDWTNRTNIYINNSRFLGSGVINMLQPNTYWWAENSYFEGYYIFACNTTGQKLWIDKCHFQSSFIVHGGISTAECEVYPINYTFSGNKVNAFRNNIVAGATITVNNQHSPYLNEYNATNANYAIESQYVLGKRIFVRNTSTINHIAITDGGGGTINGLATVRISPGHGVWLRKTGATTWVTESSPIAATPSLQTFTAADANAANTAAAALTAGDLFWWKVTGGSGKILMMKE